MSILVDSNTRLLVQGTTGSSGAFHAGGCMEYGTIYTTNAIESLHMQIRKML